MQNLFSPKASLSKQYYFNLDSTFHAQIQFVSLGYIQDQLQNWNIQNLI